MKYGVISYEKKLLKLDGKDAQNIGDWLQMFAMESLFKEWGISDLIHVSRNEASFYAGEKCIVPVSGFNTCNDAPHISTKTFPLSKNISPIFLSFHFHDRYIPEYLKAQLSAHEPIGCRDEETMWNLRRNGISAYVTGCVSAMLPRRSVEVAESADKIIFVDAPDSLRPHVPKAIENDIEYMQNVYPITRTEGEHEMTEAESNASYIFAKERYEYYFYRAKLIVTSRLHVAAPAVAMGIPCILASDNFDNRFSWIDKLLPLYTPENFDKIEWSPLPVEYEQQKADIKNALKKVILGEGDRTKVLAEVSAFYEKREKSEYNSAYKGALKKYSSIPSDMKYAIWGTVTSKSNQLKHCIEEMYPRWQFVGIFDKFARGNFEGYNIQPSGIIAGEEDVIYFVMSKTIYQEAKAKLSNGKYVLVDVTREHFDDNFM